MLQTMRPKTVIQELYLLGISTLYDCMCDQIEILKLKKHDDNKVFVRKVFTVIAKDNIEGNAKSTKVSSHYHGISLPIMQLLTTLNCGVLQENLYDL